MTPLIALALFTTIAGLFTTFEVTRSNRNYQDYLLDKQNAFNAEEAQKAREWSVDGKFNSMVNLGFNPDLAAQSVMGASGGNLFAASSPNAPQIPTADGNLGGMISGLSDMFFDTALQNAQVRNLNSQSDLNDLESFWFPLTQAQNLEVLAATKDELISKGKLNESLATMYDVETKWIEPMNNAQILEMRSKYYEAIAAARKFWAEADTQSHLQGLYDAEASLSWQRIKESQQNVITSEALRQKYVAESDVLDWQQDLTREQYISLYKDNIIREKMGDLPISNDMKENLFFMSATDAGRDEADSFIEAMLEGSSMLYDKQVQNQMDNYWKNVLLSLGHVPESLANGFGAGAGFTLGSKVVKPGVPASGAGRSVSPNPASKTPNSAPKTKVVNGKTYRSYKSVDGSEKWLPEEYWR